ncbi:MAG: dTDP-glucose 4,6-dehydratase [Rhodospirillaceae bacterium]|nr:dTDP-glucose 4,6-dehydratase [Rhodospirillaceae bacterium]
MTKRATALVTGGAGFIGSALARRLVADGTPTVVADKLTYAANIENLAPISGSPIFRFRQADICDASAMTALIRESLPDTIYHLAAESHVDRSIEGPAAFLQTNVVGTTTLLEAALEHWRNLEPQSRQRFRFVLVSTDEVFGSLGPEGHFTEASPYRPNSPYSASKASADHFARAWHTTFGLPVLVSNCSNNYGPCQFAEKLIPLMILNGLEGRPLPVYGDGTNIRDWIHVDDHVAGLVAMVRRGIPGETYLFGGRSEVSNIEMVRAICRLLDEFAPTGIPHSDLIRFVTDRPGHDHRYAIDPSKAERELGWRPEKSIAEGLRETVQWYCESWREKRAEFVAYDRPRLGLARS